MRGSVIGVIVRQARVHAVLASLVAIYAAVAFTLAQAYPVRIESSKFVVVFLRFAELVPQMIAMVLVWRLLSLTYLERSSDGTGDLKREVRGFLGDRERLAGGALATLIMTVMLVSFSQLKNLIPRLNPFAWDQFFVDLDRSLHFGRLPHEWLLPFLGSDYVVSFFAGIYNVWLFMAYFSLVIACFMRPDRPERMQFLIAFLLTWALGGNLLATVFSSAGPVYLNPMGLGDTYLPLMRRLQEHADTGMLSAVKTQVLLWTWQSGEQPLNAISAFPSMHVASSTLMAIFAFRWSRLAGIALTLFACGIMVGSVLLGWHYAVDGYAGAAIAVLCWALSGWIIRMRLVRVPAVA